jgi:hypothetical protein
VRPFRGLWLGDRSGYVQLRRGLFDHVREGKITFMEASIYIAILVDANPATGVCFGSAGLYSVIFGLPPRTVRDALEKLEKKAYLKRFTVVGKHGSYPILINKFLCTDGAAKGRYVNAVATTDYTSVLFFERDEDVELNGNDSVNEDVNESAASRRIENREKKLETKQKPLRRSKSAADERTTPFKEDFERAFKYDNNAPAPWDGKEGARLLSWLKANPTITRQQWQMILQNRHKSPVNKAAPLSIWVSKALAWLNGPADEWGKSTSGGLFNGKGTYEKPTTAERQAAELQRSIRDFGTTPRADQDSRGALGDGGGSSDPVPDAGSLGTDAW